MDPTPEPVPTSHFLRVATSTVPLTDDGSAQWPVAASNRNELYVVPASGETVRNLGAVLLYLTPHSESQLRRSRPTRTCVFDLRSPQESISVPTCLGEIPGGDENMVCGGQLVLRWAMIVLGICLAPSLAISQEQSEPSGEAKGAHVFEQRIYTTADGKLPDLHARFRNHTNYLFVKHGMHLIGYWTPNDKPNTLIYILAYPNMEAREASWKAFMDDPEWQRVWAESKEKAGGSIVTHVESTFMTPTDYSPLR